MFLNIDITLLYPIYIFISLYHYLLSLQEPFSYAILHTFIISLFFSPFNFLIHESYIITFNKLPKDLLYIMLQNNVSSNSTHKAFMEDSEETYCSDQNWVYHEPFLLLKLYQRHSMSLFLNVIKYPSLVLSEYQQLAGVESKLKKCLDEPN